MSVQEEKLYTLDKNRSNVESIPLVKTLKLGKTHLAAMAALLNIVGLGMVSGFSAPGTADMKRPGSRFTDITNSQITWIASLPSITAILGNLFSGYFSFKLGRKAVLMYVSGPYLASWLIIAYAPSMHWIYVGRLLSGLCIGACSVAVPAYVIEIATLEIRGLLGSCFQLYYAIGVLVMMSFGIILRWSWLAITGALITAVASLLMYFMPESPAWLLAKGRDSEAFESIRFLKGRDFDSIREYSATVDHIAEEMQKTISIQEFQEPQLYKPVVLAIALMFFQQFSGVSALMAYTVEIFEHAESSLDPSIAAAVIAAVQVIATLIGSTLMDKAGRRKLYLVSGVFVTVGLLILGVYGIIYKKYVLNQTVFGWIPLAGFIIFVASFSLGFGPIPYLMTPEFVPVHSRSAVLAIAGIFSSAFLFIVTKTFDDLRTFVSDYGVYWVYGFFSLLGCLFCWLCLPETKKKPIREIQQSFLNDIDKEQDFISSYEAI
ncbi:facilitated trehalose transporter Tret1-like [Stegodyphus dumicola]|uniref:facilitated trehalose transporter Tret1-like n=1 Tax=Stegodyphus dumicola TaxID=202533 RepID=UPI0015A94E1F|nr:facilitated trehalose transporter Tret1-like [Stegodyphus dumicola]